MDKRVNSARAALMDAQINSESNPSDSELCALERKLALDSRKIKYNQFLFNKQRTNAQWIKEGDANTKFFHSLLKNRRNRNSINQITLQDGSSSSDIDTIKHKFSAYFRDLLGQAKDCSPIDTDAVEQGPAVIGAHYRSLVRAVNDKEIWFVLNSMGNDKAPGPDGFSASFFKKNWSIIGKELCEGVRHCLRHNAMPKGVNAAYLALIPKNNQASKPEDYRPISCCNITYKIVASLVAGRLKEVLPCIINQAQGAFVKDRSIVDNICLGHQLFNGYGRKNISERLAWKIDLRKAYDTIDWKFLISMLNLLKFPSKFISWIEICLQSTSYSILINGEMHDFFEGRRGIRQGDPLSPFLFTIAMECLFRMLLKLTKAEGFYHHPKCHRINLSHIMFADDLIVFSSGRNSAISAIKNVVSKFLSCSGLAINCQKSHLFPGGMCKTKSEWAERTIGTSASPLPVRYLGLPLTSKSLRKKDCDIIIERITARLDCWSNMLLSRAGRRVLVASVLQAMVFFWARVCILIKTVIQAVNSICARFLWKGNSVKKGGHLVKWSDVCISKEEGGLGLKDLGNMNMAMVINQIWGKCREVGLQCISINNNVVRWRGTGDGFGVKDTYNMLTVHNETVDRFRLVWNSYNEWLVVQNKIMTIDRLSHWGVQTSNFCALCDTGIESRDHLFFECTYSQDVWSKVLGFLHIFPTFNRWDLLIPWFKGMPQTRLKTKMSAAATTRVMNGVWVARNKKIFREEVTPSARIIQETIWYLRMKLGAVQMDKLSIADRSWLRDMNFID
ncbi:hypothetical protein QQ045_028931 [Rhodiola kirilowii]